MHLIIIIIMKSVMLEILQILVYKIYKLNMSNAAVSTHFYITFY